jgi:hypothetical protein
MVMVAAFIVVGDVITTVVALTNVERLSGLNELNLRRFWV